MYLEFSSYIKHIADVMSLCAITDPKLRHLVTVTTKNNNYTESLKCFSRRGSHTGDPSSKTSLGGLVNDSPIGCTASPFLCLHMRASLCLLSTLVAFHLLLAVHEPSLSVMMVILCLTNRLCCGVREWVYV